MKHLLTIALVLLLSTAVFAQLTTDASIARADHGMVVSFAGSVDSLGGDDSTVTSAVFSIEDYDAGTNFSIYSFFQLSAIAIYSSWLLSTYFSVS